MKEEKIYIQNRQYNVANSVISDIFLVHWTTKTISEFKVSFDVSEESISQGNSNIKSSA